MEGANKAFIEQKERFLERNLIVMQGGLQDQLFGWAQLNNNLNSPKDVTEAHFASTWEFDLVKCTKSFDFVGAKDGAKKPTVYEVRLLNRIDNVPTKGRDVHGNVIKKSVQREVGRHTRKLVAYYCPWSGNKAWSTQLDDDNADFFFTATLNGCTVAVEGAKNPKVTHANFVDAATSKIDQTSINTEIARRHGIAAQGIAKDDYTNVARKSAALDRGRVLDYLATVIGFRKDNGWEFYYQSYKKFQSLGAKNPSVTLNNVVLRDRAVRLL